MIAKWLLERLSSETPNVNGGSGAPSLTTLSRVYPNLQALVRGRNVLDFGCGQGTQASALQALGAKVTGLDINQRTLALARQRFPDVRFVSDLGASENFDVVISQDAMEHFEDPQATLRLMASYVRPGGHLLITFGPPWFAPYGAHMNFFCRIPWMHLIFGESAVMAVRAKYRSDGARRYEEVESGLNRLGVGQFERMISELNFDMRFSGFECVKGLDFASKIPLLRELLTNQVTILLQKPH